MSVKPGRTHRGRGNGVSEVIGTILMLGITVVLFMSVIYMIQTIPTPQEQIHIEMESRYYGNGTVILTHAGGERLNDFETVIYILGGTTSTTDVYEYLLEDGGITEGEMALGDVWTVTDPVFLSYDTVKIIVINNQLDQIMYEAVLTMEQGDEPPSIRERYTVPASIGQGQYFKVAADVIDPDGDLDSGSVTVELTSLGLGVVPLMDVDGDGLYNSTLVQMPTATVPGEYYGKVFAYDQAIPPHSDWATLKIIVARGTSPIFEDVWYESTNNSLDPTNTTRSTAPLGWGDYFTLDAVIVDLQDDIDPARVYADLSSMGLNSSVAMYEAVPNTNVWTTTTLRVPSNLFGVAYTVSLYAYDQANHMTRYELVLRISTAPQIRQTWYEWDQDGDGTMEKNTYPIPWREDFRIWAYVYDPDGDLASVSIDLSNLGMIPALSTMTESPAGSGLYSYEGEMPGRTVLSGGPHHVTMEATDANGNSTQSQLIIFVSSGPIFEEVWKESDTVSIFLERNAYPLRWGDHFIVSAVITDPDNDLDTASVAADMTSLGYGSAFPLDYMGDGKFNTSVLLVGPVSAIPSGLHTILITASDLSGYSSNYTFQVEVSARPIVTDYWYESRDASTGLVSRNTNPVAWGQDFRVHCAVLDAAGDVSSVYADLSGFQLGSAVQMFDHDGDGDFNTSILAVPPTVLEGPHGVPVTVYGLGGSSTTVTLTITVIDSNAPVFVSVWKEVWASGAFTVSLGPVDWGQTMWVLATMNDPDQDLLDYSVYIDTQTLGQGQIQMVELSSGLFGVNLTVPLSAAEGAHSLVLNATDAAGHTAFRVYSVEVNSGPYISDVWVTDGTGLRTTDPIPRGESFLVGANVTDVNGDLDVSAVTLSLPSLGFTSVQLVQDALDAKRFETAMLVIPESASEGTHIGLITAFDDTGKSDSAQVVLKVGSGPRITEVWYSVWNGTGFERTTNPLYWGEQFRLNARISDPDANLDASTTMVDLTSLDLSASTLLADVDADGIFTSDVQTVPGRTRVSAGTHEVYFSAADAEGNLATREMTILVNAGPRIENIRHAVLSAGVWTNTTNAVQVGQSVMLFADVSDPDFNLNANSIFADLTGVSFTLGTDQMSPVAGFAGTYRTDAFIVPDSTTAGVHRVRFNATDLTGVENFAEYLLSIGSGPVISDAWYEAGAPVQRTNDPVPWGDDFRIHAYVSDPDNDLDASTVRVDLRSLGLGIEAMWDTNADNEFNTSLQTMPGDNAVSEGAHVVTLEAYDLTGKVAYARLTIIVSSGPVFRDKWYETRVLANFTRTTASMSWGDEYMIKAVVYDPDFDLDPASIIVDLSSIGGASASPLLVYEGNNTYSTNALTIGTPAQVSEGIHILPLSASDLSGNAIGTELIVVISTGPVIRSIEYSSGATNVTLVQNENPIPWQYYFSLEALITDPNLDLDPSSVTVDLSKLGLSPAEPMADIGNGYFATVPIQMPGEDVVPAGSYTVTVSASDLDGNTASMSRTLAVNSGPIISRVYYASPNGPAGWGVNQYPVAWGQNLIVYADIADPYLTLDDGTVVCDLRPLGLGWQAMARIAGTNTFATANLTLPGSNVVSEGTHIVWAYAEDNQGTNVSRSTTITVASGPIIRELWYEAFHLDAFGNATWGRTTRPVGAGDNFTVHAFVTDADGDLNALSVFVDLGAFSGGFVQLVELAGSGMFASPNCSVPDGVSERTYSLVVNATDLQGSEATAVLEIQVRQSPVIRELWYESYFLNATGATVWGRNNQPLSWGDNITIHAVVTDPDFDLDFTASYVDLSSMGLTDLPMAHIGGNEFASANVTVPSHLYDEVYYAVAVAEDLSGNTASASLPLRISSGPVVRATWYERNETQYDWSVSIAWGQNVSVAAIVTDPDGDLDTGSVMVDLTDIPGLGLYAMPLIANSTTAFRSASLTMPSDLEQIDFTGYIIASDLANSTSRYRFDINVNPSPIIVSIWHKSNFTATGDWGMNTNPVPPGETFQIFAYVTDPDFNLNYTSVECNLTDLRAGWYEPMAYDSVNRTFSTAVLVMSPAQSDGLYTLRVTATDTTGYEGISVYMLPVTSSFDQPVVVASFDPSATLGNYLVKLKAFTADGGQPDQRIDHITWVAQWGNSGSMSRLTNNLWVATFIVPNPPRDMMYRCNVSAYNSANMLLAVDSATIYVIFDSTGGGAEGWPGGLPIYYQYISFRQSFEIFSGDENQPDLDNSTHTFIQGDWCWIRVASTTMDNVYTLNELTLTNKATGEEIGVPPLEDPAFKFVQVIGDFSEYQTKFDTSTIPLGGYSVSVRLKDNDPTHQIFTMTDDIVITDVNGWSPAFPEFWVYSDSAYTIKTRDFYFTDTIYVEMKVTDSGGSPAISAVLVQDYYGGTQVSGTPPTLPFMSGITSVAPDRYRFSVNLKYAIQDPWYRGKSAYNFIINDFTDVNEGPYTMSKQINVTAPTTRLDFVVGTTGIGFGQQNFAHYNYLFHVINNNFMTTTILEEMDETPGAGGGASECIWATAFGNLDLDADLDVLASIETLSGYELAFFENRIADAGFWEEKNVLNRGTDTSKIIAIAIGDVDGDKDKDWVVSTANNNLWLYTNSYSLPISLVKATAAPVLEVKVVDITNDGKCEIVALTGGNIQVYSKDGTTLYDLGLVGVRDFDVADIDGDGNPDIATTGTGGVRKHIVGLSTYVSRMISGAGSSLGAGASSDFANSWTSDNSYASVTETPVTLGTSVTTHYTTGLDVNSAGRYGMVDAANPFANMQDGDADFTRIYEEDDASIPSVQHVADGNFANADINANWPLTTTGGFTAGTSIRDTATATGDGSGSMTARTNAGKNNHYQGYREETLASSIGTGQQTTLTLNYKKTWVAAAPTTHTMSVVAYYSTGTTATIWSDAGISNSNVWTSVTQPFTTTGTMTRVRLQFDITNSGTGADTTRYAQVWFDDVTLTVFTPNCRLDANATVGNVPAGDTYELQLLVMPIGENVELYVFNSATGWPATARTTFIAGAWTTYNDALSPDEWNSGNVFVRFVDVTKTGDIVQNHVDIQYLRVQATVNGGDTFAADWMFEVSNNPAGLSQTLLVEAHGLESFRVSYSAAAAGPWIVAGTVSGASDPNVYVVNPSVNPVIVGTFYVRFEDMDRTTADISATSLLIDHLVVQTVTASGITSTSLSGEVTWTCIGIGNVNDAGSGDVVVGRDAALAAFDGDAAGKIGADFGSFNLVLENPDSEAHGFEAGDINGDGFVDICVSGTTSTAEASGLYVYFNDGTGNWWDILVTDLLASITGGANVAGDIYSVSLGDTLGN